MFAAAVRPAVFGGQRLVQHLADAGGWNVGVVGGSDGSARVAAGGGAGAGAEGGAFGGEARCGETCGHVRFCFCPGLHPSTSIYLWDWVLACACAVHLSRFLSRVWCLKPKWFIKCHRPGYNKIQAGFPRDKGLMRLLGKKPGQAFGTGETL